MDHHVCNIVFGIGQSKIVPCERIDHKKLKYIPRMRIWILYLHKMVKDGHMNKGKV